MQSAQLVGSVYSRFPIPFLRHILPNEGRGRAEFGCQLAAFGLEHVANDNPGSFCNEQTSFRCPCPRAPPLMSMIFPLRRSILGLHLILSGMLIWRELPHLRGFPNL